MNPLQNKFNCGEKNSLLNCPKFAVTVVAACAFDSARQIH